MDSEDKLLPTCGVWSLVANGIQEGKVILILFRCSAMAAQTAVNRWVGGSSPPTGAIHS